ncbi:MAG TPA: ParB/RepB/Spo0J family partition protein [Nitrospira sp.]|nr:ParB/RepB/Spo0J family partition protein [Nitrospira sp.]
MATTIQGELLIPASKINRNPNNPRTEAGDVGELKKSIEEEGVLQALLVSRSTIHGDGYWMLEIGERRWTACRFIDPNYEIPCRIYTPRLDEDAVMRALRIGLIENVHRQDLTALEQARAYNRMRVEGHMTQAEIAKSVGLHPGTISKHLALLELAPRMQKAIETKQLTIKDATEVVKRYRAKKRKEKGYQPANVGWEPDHFNERHFLARKAKAICDGRDHNNRRRRGGACDPCWEDAIRRDEDVVLSAHYREQGFDVPFVSPVMAAVGNSLGQGGTH